MVCWVHRPDVIHEGVIDRDNEYFARTLDLGVVDVTGDVRVRASRAWIMLGQIGRSQRVVRLAVVLPQKAHKHTEGSWDANDESRSRTELSCEVDLVPWEPLLQRNGGNGISWLDHDCGLYVLYFHKETRRLG